MKRQRGGQQGNRNACKHGLYSSQLSPGELELYNNFVNHEHMSLRSPSFVSNCGML